MTDITDPKKMELELRKYKSIIESTDDAIISTTLSGVIQSWNYSAEMIFGYTAKEAIGRQMQILIPSDRLNEEVDILARIARGERVIHFETLRLHKDGRLINISTTISPIHDDKGIVIGASKIARDITERKMGEEMLRFHSAILNSLTEGIYLICTSDGVIVFTNQPLERLFGYESGELLGKHVSIVSAPSEKSHEEFTSEIIGELVRVGVWNGEVRNIRKNGTIFWCNANVTIFEHPQFGPVWLVVQEDITERKNYESALRKERDFIKAILDTAGNLIVVLDRKGHIVRLNRIGESLTGYRFEEIREQPFWDIFLLENERAGVAAAFDRLSAGDIVSRYENHWRCKDGSIRLFDWYNTVLLDDQGEIEFLVAIANDITETKKLMNEIKQLAFYDPLTHLPNRRLLNDRLGQTMAAHKRSNCFGALMFLDLDNFKPINDTHGHSVGDLLLIEVARRISSCMRDMDTVARFGGDEFVIMLSELDVDKSKSTAQASIVAEKIRVTLAEPYLLTIKQVGKAECIVEHHCTSSIGVVMFTNHEASPEDILKWADIAMYQAKDGGRNSIRFYDAKG
jgi:diguanylate cyclase (GGDEF)-like protein/PAS domain S-box-containing protein